MTPREVKDAVRKRDGKCIDCGRLRSIGNKSLHVHRLVPGSEYTMEGCVTLCHGCHAFRHRKHRYAVEDEPMDLLPALVTTDYLCDLRRTLGLRANAFAARLGVHESTVSYWESGRSHPRWKMLGKLNQLLAEFGLDHSPNGNGHKKKVAV